MEPTKSPKFAFFKEKYRFECQYFGKKKITSHFLHFLVFNEVIELSLKYLSSIKSIHTNSVDVVRFTILKTNFYEIEEENKRKLRLERAQAGKKALKKEGLSFGLLYSE